MAAYAALLSLKFIINQVQQHPHPPISVDKQKLISLNETLSFLQNFLEGYSKEEHELENRIADAAYEAEDVIESHIIDQVHAGSTSHISSIDFYQGLERVIQVMDLIKKDVITIKEKMGAQHSTNSSVSIATPISHISRIQNNTIMDFGDILTDVMYKLTTQQHDLEIVPIVGMGGIGKTTLARNIYAHPLIVQHFHFLAWVTISQECSVPQILLQVLSEENNGGVIGEDHKLGERVYKKLWGRRYLIVLDDIWSIKPWDRVKSFFPNNNNGSKIMITTRLSNLAFQLSGSHDFQMKFLEDDKSWDLLCKIVFGKECCPVELENVGKEIARNCRGLPLSIVVIGGVLAKANMALDYWESTLRNLSSLINLENREHCLQILRTSYKELPVHLKPCFLYMGIFPEDYIIYVPRFIKLCVAEGFLKPIENKTLEEVAKVYVKELIDRNLILVHEWSWNGKAKSCKIHDLLRDLCLREGRKHKFVCVLSQQDLNIPKDIDTQRRICIHYNKGEKAPPEILDNADQHGSLTRSLILFSSASCRPPSSSTCRLLRVYACFDYVDSFYRGHGDAKPLLKKANLRYLSMGRLREWHRFGPTSWNLLWNLQTLEFITYQQQPATAPSQMLKMPCLRHVMVLNLGLPDLPLTKDDIVLENLQTLSRIDHFKCGEMVLKRISNIKKLNLFYYGGLVQKEGLRSFCLNNLCRLKNLTSLKLSLAIGSSPFQCDPGTMQNLSLPDSLKKLYLEDTKLLWEDMATKIGSLPLLEALILQEAACVGSEWETVEGQFCSLKLLRIGRSKCLRCWTVDETHFPRLEHLVLEYLSTLKEIPSSIGDIPTLQSIKLEYCRKSVNDSAKIIKEEQVSNGNVDLQVLIGEPWEKIFH